MKTKLLNVDRDLYYRNIKDFQWCISMLHHIIDCENVVVTVRLGKGIRIQTSLAKAVINIKLMTILDSYGLGLTKETRKQYIFTEGYSKGEPLNYMERVNELASKEWSLPEPKYIILPYFLSEVKEIFGIIAVAVDTKNTVSFSITDTFEEYLKNPTFKAILKDRYYDKEDDIYTIQDKHRAMINRFTSEVKMEPISTLLRSGVKCNPAQLAMWLVWGGVPSVTASEKLDKLSGFVDSGIMNGFKTKYELLIMFAIQRKTLMALTGDIQKTGETQKHTSAVFDLVHLNNIVTGETLDDCGTTNYTMEFIKDKKTLLMNIHKYFLNDNGEYEVVTKDRTDLIGTTIRKRSIHKCEGEDVICKMCCGANSEWLSDNQLFRVHLGNRIVTTLSPKIQGVNEMASTARDCS